jgi:hypothetical protein
MFKKIIIVFIVFGSMAFFEPVFIDRQMTGLIHMAVTALIFVFLVIYAIYDTSTKIKATFTWEVIMVFFAVFLSMIGAFVFHFQKFQITLMAQRIIYLFLFYFLLHQLKPSPQFVIKIFMIVSIFWLVFYIIQWAVYPVHLFGDQIFKDRNTIRIFLPGVSFAVIAYFISLMEFMKTNHYKYLVHLLLLLLGFVLMGTRQLLGPTLLITVIAVVQSKKIHSKMVLIILGIASVIPLYFVFQEIINAMLDVTKKESLAITENVRYKAVMFYLYRFAPSKLSFLIGNGAYSGHSSYGLMMDNYSKAFGYYLADIGIIGEFILYGIFFALAELIVLFRTAFIRYSDEFQFIKYTVYSMFFSIFVGAGAFSTGESIIMMCLLLYLVDVSKWLKKQDTSMPVQT